MPYLLICYTEGCTHCAARLIVFFPFIGSRVTAYVAWLPKLDLIRKPQLRAQQSRHRSIFRDAPSCMFGPGMEAQGCWSFRSAV